MTRQLILDLEPRKPVLRPDVIVGTYTLRLIETAQRDLHPVS